MISGLEISFGVPQFGFTEMWPGGHPALGLGS